SLESLLQELTLGMLLVRRRCDAGRQRLVLVFSENLLEPFADDRATERARDELAVGLRLHARQRTGETERNFDLAFLIRQILRFAKIRDHVIGELARCDERRREVEIIVERVSTLAEHRVVARLYREIVALRDAVRDRDATAELVELRVARREQRRMSLAHT